MSVAQHTVHRALVGLWLSATLVVVTAVMGVAPPAAAAAVRSCSSTSPVSTDVAGDLSVPAGATCALREVSVGGDVVLGPGSRLDAQDSTVTGDLRGAERAHLGLQRSTVGGGVKLAGASLEGRQVTIGRSIRGTSPSVVLGTSEVHGAINVTGSRDGRPLGAGLQLVYVTVHGWVNQYGGPSYISRSDLLRGLTLSATHGARVCLSRISADVVVRWSHGPFVEMRQMTGPDEPCFDGDEEQTRVIGGSVSLLHNRGGVAINTAAIAGDLVCEGNTGVADVSRAVVAGRRTGACR